MKCNKCNQDIKSNDGKHIYYCGFEKLVTNSEQRKQIKYEHILFNYPCISYDFMYEKYINELYSLPMFKNEFGILYGQTKWILEYYQIPIRTLSESMHQNTLQKRKETTFNRYGVDNISQLNLIKERKRTTSTKKYGVSNIFSTLEFKESHHNKMIKKYGKGSLPNRYGKMQAWWDSQTDEFKINHMRPARKGFISWLESLSQDEYDTFCHAKSREIIAMSSSLLETRIMRILQDNGIYCIHQFWVNRKSYDFYLNDKILIEVQGDFWHANPIKYKNSDILNHPGGKVSALDIWEKDKNKKENAKKYGYQLIYIWEHAMNNMTDAEIAAYIQTEISKLDPTT